MDKRGLMILKVLTNRYNPKVGNALLKFLPQDEAQIFMQQNIHSIDLTPILQHSQKSVERIHYSWIQPLLKNFPISLQPTVIACLTEEQMRGLKTVSSIPVSPLTKTFILNQLSQQLDLNSHFPLEYLPETELSPLSTWTKSQLTNLIDFLGLYDLASEIRHIVNRNYLKNIYTCLTPKQFHYLKLCLHQKEQLISPKLGVDLTKQNCDQLKKVIHRRGLVRLGKALCGQDSDLVWHIVHRLDRGRGTLLLQEYRHKELPKVTPILKQQVLNLMSFL